MKQTFSFDRNEAATLIAQGIAIKYGIAVNKVAFIMEETRTPVGDQPTGVWELTKVKAWLEEE